MTVTDGMERLTFIPLGYFRPSGWCARCLHWRLRAQFAEPVRADVEADVGHVVQVLARYQPHDVADLALAVVPAEPFKGVRRDLLVPGELRRVVESRPF